MKEKEWVMMGKYELYLYQFEIINKYFKVSDRNRVSRFIYDNNLFDALCGLRNKLIESFGEDVNLIIGFDRDDQDNIKTIVVVIDVILPSRIAREKIRVVGDWFDNVYSSLSNFIELAIVTEMEKEE